jgi:hypothetical protein
MGLMQTIQRGKTPMPPRLLIYGTEGIGKAQPLDAKVLTPHGFVAMGMLNVGDEVIGSDGRPHRVLGVYPQGEKEVFRVTFRDGSTTRCCEDHLWFTQTCHERDLRLRGSVRTLRDIRRTLRYGTHFNHAVPRVRPVQFAPLWQRLPIDPWLLGVYLGDGCSSGNVLFINPEPDIRAKVASSLDDTDACVESGGIALRVKSKKRTNRPAALKAALKELGLDGLTSHEKFIPFPYLHAGVDQRLSLLRGLMDSDGFVTNPGAIEFCTTSPRLAEDVCFLIRSLGGSAKTILRPYPIFTHRGQRRRGRPAYRIFASFPNDVVPVSSEKHLRKWATPQWAIRHTIRSIEPVGRAPCQCIRVDASDSLYVTDDFILTHNSTLAASAPKPIFVQTEDGLNEIVCDKFPLATTVDDVLTALAELREAEHGYETVVLDSLDWTERLIWDAICQEYRVTSIEKADGGYQRGYVHALAHWRKVVDALNLLRVERSMIVILIAHAKVEKFEDPETTTYDRYSPRLHKHACALLTEWCDAVLFATRKIITKSEDVGFGRERTIAIAVGTEGGERILRTVGGPACVAKNRYSLPAELPLSWPALMDGLTNPNPSAQGEVAHG